MCLSVLLLVGIILHIGVGGKGRRQAKCPHSQLAPNRGNIGALLGRVLMQIGNNKRYYKYNTSQALRILDRPSGSFEIGSFSEE